jgi:hypothetical protein
MSHWLSNVNYLLTKLDDQVETVVEERAFAQDDLSSKAIGDSRTGIDDILAKRGLSSTNSKDETEEEEEGVKVEKKTVYEDGDNEDDKQFLEYENDEKKAKEIKIVNEAPVEPTKGAYTNKTIAQSFAQSFDNTPNNKAQNHTKRKHLDKVEKSSTFAAQQLLLQQDSGASSSKVHVVVKPGVGELERKVTSLEDSVPQKVETMDGKPEWNPIKQHEIDASPNHSTLSKSKDESMPSTQPPPPTSIPTTSMGSTVAASSALSFDKDHNSVHSPDRSRKDIRELVIERKEAQKEARTLRRHIVSLNDQLETAESELQAQRKELERAAERMEKDRSQYKEEKEASQKRNGKEITVLKAQHDKSLKEQQARFEEQLERYRKKLSDEEKRRTQEGGDWDKEISNAIDREQDMQQRLNLLEDEKAVFLSQISTLQGQQTALGSRLESLSEAADNALQRERDAENRLDLALNQHARQIGNRQVS